METKKKKTLQELTFKDDFMFAAVMMDEENAKGVLERTLGMEIDRIEISSEKSLVYHPEYKGVRLDVYMKDSNNTRFNVEMQVANEKIFKRARYYHDQIDMEILESGVEYEKLPDVYVIFICDFDPIGLGKYKYTIVQGCLEDKQYEYDDGCHTMFLSTVGKNDEEVSEDLLKFLKFVGAKLEDSNKDYSDEFVNRLQKSVTKIKKDREMGRRYMLFELICRDEFKAGKAEGIVEGKTTGKVESILCLLKELGPVSDCLEQKLLSINSDEELTNLLKLAAKSESVESFEEKFLLVEI